MRSNGALMSSNGALMSSNELYTPQGPHKLLYTVNLNVFRVKIHGSYFGKYRKFDYTVYKLRNRGSFCFLGLSMDGDCEIEVLYILWSGILFSRTDG